MTVKSAALLIFLRSDDGKKNSLVNFSVLGWCLNLMACAGFVLSQGTTMNGVHHWMHYILLSAAHTNWISSWDNKSYFVWQYMSHIKRVWWKVEAWKASQHELRHHLWWSHSTLALHGASFTPSPYVAFQRTSPCEKQHESQHCINSSKNNQTWLRKQYISHRAM